MAITIVSVIIPAGMMAIIKIPISLVVGGVLFFSTIIIWTLYNYHQSCDLTLAILVKEPNGDEKSKRWKLEKVELGRQTPFPFREETANTGSLPQHLTCRVKKRCRYAYTVVYSENTNPEDKLVYSNMVDTDDGWEISQIVKLTPSTNRHA